MIKRQCLTPYWIGQPLSFMQPIQRLLFLLAICVALLTGILKPSSTLLWGKLTDIFIEYSEIATAETASNGSQLEVEEKRRSAWLHQGTQIVALNISIGLAVVALNFIQCLLFRYIALSTANRLKERYMRFLLEQSAHWWSQQSTGAVLAQLNIHIPAIQDGIGEKLGFLLQGMATFVTTNVFALYINWRISLVSLPIGPCAMLIMWLMRKLDKRSKEKQLSSEDKASAVLQESLTNIRSLQACNGTDRMLSKYREFLSETRRHGTTSGFYTGLFNGLFFMLLNFFSTFGIIFGALLYNSNGAASSSWPLANLGSGLFLHHSVSALSPGDVFIVTNLVIHGAYFLGNFSPQILGIANAFAFMKRVCEQLQEDTNDKNDDDDGVIMKPVVDKNIKENGRSHSNKIGMSVCFNSVSFTYPTRRSTATGVDGQKALNKVSWEAEPGKIVALVGKSGSGKSTCLALFGRQYQKQQFDSGSILLDGVPIGQHPPAFRKGICIVPQEPELVHGFTVAENIHLGKLKDNNNRQYDEQWMHKVCKIAGASEFIEKLPKGYSTCIGTDFGQSCNGLADQAVELSGGEKQRVAIARALFRRPRLLLLDEATAALDGQSEVAILKALCEYAAESRCTIVTVTHRLETLHNTAHRIVFLDQGCVLEQGTPEQLGSNVDTHFSKLLRMQEQKCQKTTVKADACFADAPSVIRSKSNEKDLLHLTEKNTKKTKRSSELPKEKTRFACLPSLATVFCRFFWPGPIFRACTGQHLFQLFGLMATVLLSTRPAHTIHLQSMAFVAFELLKAGRIGADSFHHQVDMLLIYGTALGIFCLCTSFAGIYLLTISAERTVMRWKHAAFGSVLRKRWAFFHLPGQSRAEMIGKINEQPGMLKAVIDIRLHQLVTEFSSFWLLLTMTFWHCWQIGVAGTGALFFILAIVSLLGKKIQRAAVRAKQREEHAVKLSNELLEKVRTIRTLCSEAFFYRKYQRALANARTTHLDTACCSSALYAFTHSFAFLCDGLCFGTGLWLIHQGIVSPADAFAAARNIAAASWGIMAFSAALNDLFRARPALEFLDILPDKDAKDGAFGGNGKQTTIEMQGNMRISDIAFSYPGANNGKRLRMLDGMHLDIRSGQQIAIVGRSGSGKSTLFNLLLQFYTPDSGKIHYDGIDSLQICPRLLHSQIALVEQEPVLFSGTIAENVQLGAIGQLSMEEVREACKLANAAAFIEQLPQGYETNVGSKGHQVSGGEKQRIAIARALARKPRILLLDEPNSALDAQSALIVQGNIATLLANPAHPLKTCLTISHLLNAAVEQSEQIFVLENGRLAERGTHSELLSRPNSLYARMFLRQRKAQ